MNTKNESVLLKGSQRLGRIPDAAVGMLESLMESGCHFLVGDDHGTDLAFQNYLHAQAYRKVTVYCMGTKCRFNLGDWSEKHIQPNEDWRNICKQTDFAMLKDCSISLVIWDGRSVGTKNLIRYLKAHNVPLLIYRTDTNRFHATRKN